MFKPPINDPWNVAKAAYKGKLKVEVPQWVLTLNWRYATELLKLCTEMKWVLPATVIEDDGLHQGDGSLWGSKHVYKWDIPSKPQPNKLNPQNTPKDIAEGVKKASNGVRNSKSRKKGVKP